MLSAHGFQCMFFKDNALAVNERKVSIEKIHEFYSKHVLDMGVQTYFCLLN